MNPTLAINGGAPARPAPILPCCRISNRTRQRVSELLDGGCFSDWYGGPISHEFEEAFASYMGAAAAVAVNSGTSALHLAVSAIGIQPGDEVIVPTALYVSAASVVIQERGIPIGCDIDARTMTMDVDDVKKRITARTRAIIPVHFWGCPVDMASICSIAKQHDLVVIEDCGQSHGARVNGRMTGGIGDFGCFSLAPRKHVSTGQGGIVTCKTKALAQRLRELANKGKGLGWLDYKSIGFSYVMPDFEALIGLNGLEQLENEVEIRRAAVDIYRRVLAQTPLQIPGDPPWGQHVYFKVPILLPEAYRQYRDFVVKALSAENVSCRPPHPPLYTIPWIVEYLDKSGRPMAPSTYPVTDRTLKCMFEVESGPNLSSSDVEVSANAVLKVWNYIAMVLERGPC